MDKNRFISLIEETMANVMQLTATKGEEYSRDDDQLANFKRAAKEAMISPNQAWVVFFNKHIDSIKTHAANPLVQMSEPINGRIDDAILYLLLYKAIVEDQKEKYHTKEEKFFATAPKPGKP